MKVPAPLALSITMSAKEFELKHGSNEKVDILDTSITDSEANHELYDGGATSLHRTMKNRHISMIRCVLSL